MATSATSIDWKAAGDRCVSLLQDLIRIPTVNRGPEGCDERPAAELLAEYLREGKLDPVLLEPEPRRTSVVVRLRGTGQKPPILLNAHLDVVEADASKWRHDPFKAEIHDGYIWGRGAVDMKHMAAMSAVVMRLLAEHVGPGKLDRDVIFAGVADEEAACTKGSLFLVDQHPEKIRAEYTLGEIGAFSQTILGRTFYPIQTAEKGVCWVRATFEGEPGHGSMPKEDNAVLKLARAVTRLGKSRLPQHPTEAVTKFFDAMASELPAPQRHALKRLKTPQVAALILDYLVRDESQRRTFSALLSNTATPTVIRGGNKVNVIPGKATLELDGRTLPGQTESSFLAELRDVLGEEAKLEVMHSLPPVETTERTPLFSHLANVLRKHDPLALPIPFVIPGFTDAKAYAKLGSKCYGFAPIKFDPTHEISFSAMYHGHDERVPVEGLKWGLHVLFDAVAGFCQTG
jgi:acetylornithine deacetylase/succinyl-diaminopimelate desuccinylase-like protein